MKNRLTRWLFTYGVFLMLIGLAGYLSNPGKAKTALISGGTFGLFSLFLGVLNARGIGWSRKAALGTLIFLGIVFIWRTAATWMAFFNGRPEKLFAACLITLMLAATQVMLFAMFRRTI